MIGIDILQYQRLYTKIGEAETLFGQRLFVVDSPTQELILISLIIPYLKGWKALEGENTSKLVIMRTCSHTPR